MTQQESNIKSSALSIGLVIDDSLDSTAGVQQFVMGLGTELANRGHHVTYLAGQTSSKHPLASSIESMSKTIEVAFNKNRLRTPLPASKGNIKRVIDQMKFDIVHVMTPYSPFMAGRVIKALPNNTPVIGTFHIAVDGQLAWLGSRLLALTQRYASLRRVTYWTAASVPAKHFGEQVFGCKVSALTFNPVNIAHFAEAKSTFNKTKKIQITYLGRLVSRKGAQHLIEAIALLPEQSRELIAVRIGGSGHLANNLKQRVEDLGLQDLIVFDGFIPESDKASYLASADIVVLPSTGGECFGISVVEVMATRRAVVLAGDNQGYRSILAKRPELLFTPDDHQLLSDKLQHFIGNSAARAEAAQWQFEEVQKYSHDNLARQVETLYYQLINKSDR